MELKKTADFRADRGKDYLYRRKGMIFEADLAPEQADEYTLEAVFDDNSSACAQLTLNGRGASAFGYTECRTGRERRAAFVVSVPGGLSLPVRAELVDMPDVKTLRLWPGRRQDVIDAAKADRARPHEVRPSFVPEKYIQLVCSAGADADARENLPGSLESMRELCPYIRSMGFNGVESYVKWNFVEYEKGKFDWSFYDSMIELASDYELKWFPLIIGGSAYALPEWYRENTEGFEGFECLEHGESNNVPTIFNDQQTPYVVRYLHELGKHYEGNKNVFGIRLGPSGNYGESQYPASGNWGYKGRREHMHIGWWAGGESACARFREYLRREYGGIAALNAAWQEENASFEDIRTFLPEAAEIKRKRKDFVDWYMYEMTLWCDKWGVWVRDELKSHDIFQSSGGWGMCECGTDFTDQTRGMVPINGGIRATNEDESYELNFAITRMLSSSARFYGVKFGSEPAGYCTARGVIARLYNAIVNNAYHLFYYFGNFTCCDETAEQFAKYVPLLEARTAPTVDVAVMYPDTMTKLTDSCLRYLDGSSFFSQVFPLRRKLDFDFCSERMALDGALPRYKALVFLSRGHEGDFMEKNALEKVDEYVRAGGTVIYPIIHSNVRPGVATVEEDFSIYDRWTRGDTGKGRVVFIHALREPLDDYIDAVAQALAEIPGMDAGTYAMLGAEKPRGVYMSALSNGKLAVYNDRETAAQITLPDGRSAELPPISITML